MYEGGSWSFAVVGLLIILFNGFVPVAQLLDRTVALNDVQQESARIGNSKYEAAWIQNYLSPDQSKVCRKSTRSKKLKKVKIKANAASHDTQIEPPQHVNKYIQLKSNLTTELLKKIQPIPKINAEKISSSKPDNNAKIDYTRNKIESIEKNNSDINLHHNDSVNGLVDGNSSGAMWKQNENETSQNVSWSNIPIGNPQDNVQDAVSNASFEEIQMHGEADSTKGEPPEHMPSFDEWKKEKLEEEMKKGQSSNGGISKVKPKSNLNKNYAAADCGAKILAKNAESHNSHYILNNQRDEYMLSPCNVNKWFVVELCESVQSQSLEIASFELYSSLLKDFTIYASERYPPREWTFLGQHELVNELGVQKFLLPDQIFGKYIKVEFSSHHGTEHFCVLSMLRIYGTSMVEEIEGIDTAEHSNELDDDSPLGKSSPSGGSESGFLGTARNVVYKIVEKATNVITGGKENQYDVNSTRRINEDLNEVQIHSSNSVGLDLTVDESNFSNISKLLYELNKTLGLIDYKGSPHYLSLNFLSHLSKILVTCSTCKNSISDLLKASFVESSMACKYLQAIIGSSKFNILCRLFKLYCYPIEQTQISVKTFHGHSAILMNMFKKYFCSSILNEQSFVCASQSLNETESLKEFIKDQKFAPKFQRQSNENYFNESSSHLETQIEATILSIDSSSSVNDKTKMINNESSNGESSEKGESSTPVTILPDNPSDSYVAPSKVIEEVQATEQSNIVIPSFTSNYNSQSSFILLKPSIEVESESSEIKTLPLSTENGASASLIQPSKSEVQTEAVSSPSSDDAASSSSSILPDFTILSEVIPSLSENSNVVNISDQSQNFSIDETTEIPSKPSTSQTLSASKQTSSQQSSPSNQPVNQEVISGGQKESIFMRLSNRIKSLELNLSLSSLYLEELSKRYRKQMDQMTEMQKIFNRSMGSLNEISQKSKNTTMHLQNKVVNLEIQVTNLTHYYKVLVLEKEIVESTLIQWHIFLIIVELIAFTVIFVACVKFSTNNIITKFTEMMQKPDNYGHFVNNHNPGVQNVDSDINAFRHVIIPTENNLLQRESPTNSNLQGKNRMLTDHGSVVNENLDNGLSALKVKKKNRSKKHSRSQSNEFQQYGYDPSSSSYSARSARFSLDNSVYRTKIEPRVKNNVNFKHSSAGVLFSHVSKDISMKLDAENGNENKAKSHVITKSGNLNRPPCNKFSVLANINSHENVSYKNSNHRRKYL